MALINKRTGFYGFTADGLGGIKSDKTGSVKKCIISIAYQVHLRNVRFSISGGADDWGAQMGDGSIIPLSNPNTLYVNRDSAIVEFDMATAYAANSPCALVYRSDTAAFKVVETDDGSEVYENTLSGHFAFTVEGYGGKSYDLGYVDRVLATIPFPVQVSDVEFSISAGDDHWGARMGDGSIIPLVNPEVLVTNADNAVIKFEMTQPYPSNSPCMIVYRSPEASFHLEVVVIPPEYVPVTDITEVPESLVAGTSVDLSPCCVAPTDATVQGISWMVMSGPAKVEGDTLTTTGQGTVVLKATVAGGKTEEGEDFTKTFNIPVKANKITILAHPTQETTLTHGVVRGNLTVIAKSDTGVISYKWYQNKINSYTNATPVHNGAKSSYTFPVDISAGIHYYFCEISSPGATSVRSNIAKVNVLVELDSVTIIPEISSMLITSTQKFDITHLPEDAHKPQIAWTSSDHNVVQIDEEGNALAVNQGSAVITATTLDGRYSDSIKITVPAYVSVTNITGLITTLSTGVYSSLVGTVVPSNATEKSIQWAIIDQGTTEAIISNNRLYASKAGTVRLKATIIKGISPTQDFIKEFSVIVTKAFIAVTDVTLVDFPVPIRCDQTAMVKGKVTPADADYTDIIWTISQPGSTGATLVDGVISFTDPGTVILLATILNGKSPSVNFTKEFSIKINDPWVAIDHVELTPTEYDPNPTNGEAIKLTAIVYPENATKKDVIMKMLDDSVAKATFDAATQMLQVNPKNMKPTDEPVVMMELTVIDGYTEGRDYVVTHNVRIIPPAPEDEYVPIDRIDLVYPEPMRCHYPVLLERFTVYPWNASEINARFRSQRAQEYGGADNIIFNPNEYAFSHTQKKEFFDWGLDENYLFPYDPGKINLNLTVVKGLGPEPGQDYIRNFELDMLPPYIAAKDISNIPIEVPVGKDFILSGEVETQGGIGYHNPTWDEEVPSFDNIIWRIGDDYFDTDEYPNRANAVLKGENGNTLYCNRSGQFTIQAYIENGKADAVKWYDKTQIGEPFTKLFTIKAVSDTTYNKAIVTLTLNTGTKVRVYSMGDLNNLCNDLPSDTTITINGTPFRKDQVVGVSFWEESYVTDSTVAIKDISLDKIELEPYELIAPEVEVESFDGITPSNDSDGCITIMDTKSAFYGMKILPDNVYLLPDGTIIRYYDSKSYFTTDGSGTITGLTPEGKAMLNLPIPSIIDGEEITAIGSNAFDGATFSIVLIPKTVTIIGAGAFNNCSNLTTVIIDNGIETIEDGAFAGCDDLINVFYTGSEEDWNEIDISNTDDSNAVLINATKEFEYDINLANSVKFMIDEVEYTALNGMTWEEWVNSEFNTKGFTSNGANITETVADETMYVAVNEEDGMRVLSTDIINANHHYVTGTADSTHSPDFAALNIGDGDDVILNLKYAHDIFKVDPSIIQIPDSFVRYDNGWVGIPAGTILSTSGSLIVPNPEYGATSFHVTGIVTYSDGTPFVGAKVRAMMGTQQVGAEATTSPEGKYTIKNLPIGNYRLIADNGYGDTVATDFMIDGETEIVDLKFSTLYYEASLTIATKIMDNQKLSDISISGIALTVDDKEVAGKFSWVTTDDEFDTSYSTSDALWKFTPNNTNRYLPVYGTVTFTVLSSIIKKAPSPVTDILIHNGSRKSPTWNDYDSDQLTMGGDTSGTDAGMYYTTFTPKGLFTWEDGSQKEVSISWGIYMPFHVTKSNRGTVGYDSDSSDFTMKETFISSGIMYAPTSMDIHVFDSCTHLKTLSIPGTMTEISEMAFDQCSGLTKVVINEGVSIIGACAFQQCSSLTEITIPASLTQVGSNAFSGCSKLSTVNYGGTKEQWNKLKVNISSGNSRLTGATIKYTEEVATVEEEGEEAPVIDPTTPSTGGSTTVVPEDTEEDVVEDKEPNYDVYPMLYEISIHGIVFDHTTSRILFPDGTCILNASKILLPHNYTYDPDTTYIDPVSVDESDILIKMPYGVYMNSSKQICVLDLKSLVRGMTAVNTETGNFLRLTDGSLIHESGIVYTSAGKLYDIYQRAINENSYFNLTGGVNFTPSNASNKSIDWTFDEIPEGTVVATLPTNGGDTLLIIAGNKSGYMILDAYVTNGYSSRDDYEQKLLIAIGDVSDEEDRLIDINFGSVTRTVYKGYSSTNTTLTIDLFGTSEEIEDLAAEDIEWSITGGYKPSYGGGYGRYGASPTVIYPRSDNLSAYLYISSYQETGSTITVTVTCGDFKKELKVNVATKYSYGEPYVGSLRNFGRNFINLKSINHIPSTVNGDDCLRNFLMGCTSFNQAITIPDSVAGDRCLQYFLRDCTSFNSKVTIPEEIYGEDCLHGFLYGCESFNKAITIPEGVTGNGCLERFLMCCKSFNQNITIPEGIQGDACLRNFMTECHAFNRPIRIPDGITGENSMDLFMRDCNAMVSNVTISKQAARSVGVNGQTLSTVFSQSDMFINGVPIIGDGARLFMRKAYNVLGAPPYRKLSTVEPEDEEFTITVNQVEGVNVTTDLDAAFEIDTVEVTVEITDELVTDVQLSIDDPDIELVSIGENKYEFTMGIKNVVIDVTVTRREPDPEPVEPTPEEGTDTTE